MNEQAYLEKLSQLRLDNWPPYLPKHTHYPFGEKLLTDYLKEWRRLTPEKPCIIYYGNELTFEQLDDLSNRFAAFLANKNFKKGDRVAVYLNNCPQFLIVFYGILKLGCIHVPVNPMLREYELIYELNDSGAEAIVALDLLYPLVEAVKDETSLREVIVTSFADFLPKEATIPVHESLLTPRMECPNATDFMSILADQRPDFTKVEVTLDDVVALNYTGGTTGLPKGCEHTQRDMLYTAANVATFHAEITSNDVFLHYLPAFWIAGEITGVILSIVTGATTIMLTRWDTKAVLAAIEKYKVTHTGGVTDNIVELMYAPDINEYNLSSVKVVLVASFMKKLNVNYRSRWNQLNAGIIREASFGMTETHTYDTFTNGMHLDDMDLKSQPVFCGYPVPGTEIKIVDFATGEFVPLGEEGEIVIRTPSLMKSYWGNPEETARVLRNGWLYTGDVGMLDDKGYLHFLGRSKEMLKVNGMSVFPSEIEVLLGRHPAITASAVLGKPDTVKGEVPVAFIMLHSDFKEKLTEQDITKWCRDNMAIYKVPIIRIVEELPLTATGKVIKNDLMKELEKQ